MKPLLLTRIDGSKQLVNMVLVSEAVAVKGSGSYTNLVVPSAAYEDARYIAVLESLRKSLKCLIHNFRIGKGIGNHAKNQS